MSIEKIMEKIRFVKEGGSCFECCDYEEMVKDLRTSLEEYGRERFEAGFKMGLTEDEGLKPIEENECEHNYGYRTDRTGYLYEECIKCGKVK